MQLFDDRIRDFKKLEKGYAEWHEVRLRYRNSITHSCRQDYRSFFDGVLEEMKVAASKGDSKKVSELVKQLSGCNVSSTGAKPTDEYDGETKASGRLFGSEKELAAAWKLFVETKFAATAREECRGDLPDIGIAESSSADVPSDVDPEICMIALADAKMHGLDGISIEAYKASIQHSRDRKSVVLYRGVDTTL